MGFGGLFSDGDKDVESEVKYPEWVNQAGKAAGATAQKIAAQPYKRYTGARVAPRSQNQRTASGFALKHANKPLEMVQSGFQLAKSTPGQFAGQFNRAGNQIDSGFRLAQDVGQQKWSSGTAKRYMSPYRDIVFKRINEQAAQNQFGTDAEMINQGGIGAFGDARAGVLAGQNEEARLNAVAAAEADAYESARSAFEGEQGRRLASADLMGTQGSRYGALTQGEQDAQLRSADLQGTQGGRYGAVTAQTVADLSRTGAVDQAQTQASLDTAYSDFLEQRDWLQRGLNAYLQALGGSPGSTGGSQGVATPSTAQQLVGLGVAGAGLFAGGQNSAASGIYSMFF